MAAKSDRPATAIDVPPGFWQREASHYPKPLTPLGASFLLTGINQSFRKVFEEVGLPIEGLEFREIGGYVYQRMKPLGTGDSAPRKLPPKFVLWLAVRLHPAFRRRAARCKQVVSGRVDREYVERWYDEWRPQLVRDIERLRGVDLPAMTDEQLAAHLDELWRWGQYCIDVHFLLTIATFPLLNLTFFCRDHLGYDERHVLVLLAGLSGTSSEPAVVLAKLADRIRSNDEVTKAVLAADPAAVPSLLVQHSPDLAAAFHDYIHRYGCRALRYELVEQCLSERPELVAGLLQDELRRPNDLEHEQARLAAARTEAKAAALAALATEELRQEFCTLLEEAERAYPIREDNEFYTISVPLALTRFAVLEAGKRLAANEALADADDVFLLRFEELSDVVRSRQAAYKKFVEQRREERAMAEAFDPPAVYGEEPPPPPLDVFPPETRQLMEGLLYVTEKVFEPELSNRREDSGAREIKGIAAARGTYTGPARIILGEDQFDRLQPGDVLVCPITSPVWSILFAKIGALVTDSGGVLSHPAIIAREYGIPAVVATGNATQIIADGQRVVVDGEAGVVRLVGDHGL